jgi:hypothetical protein
MRDRRDRRKTPPSPAASSDLNNALREYRHASERLAYIDGLLQLSQYSEKG